MSEQKVVLIAGGSSGIGAATARLLEQSGYRVFVTSRKPSSSLAHVVQMEAGNTESVNACVSSVLAAAGRIDVLIYSIGDRTSGAIEEVTIEESMPVLETTFLGAVRTVRAVLPSMRAQSHGRIVLMSSSGGVIGVPFRGLYSAAKFAVEGFAQSLRHEMHAFGIHVTVVEPAGVRTTATDHVRRAAHPIEAYEPLRAPFTTRFEAGMKEGLAPEVVAAAIKQVLEQKRPPSRRRVGSKAKVLSWLRRLLPESTSDRVMRRTLLPEASQRRS